MRRYFPNRKVHKKDAKSLCNFPSKSKIVALKRRHWDLSEYFLANSLQIRVIILVSLFFTVVNGCVFCKKISIIDA